MNRLTVCSIVTSSTFVIGLAFALPTVVVKQRNHERNEETASEKQNPGNGEGKTADSICGEARIYLGGVSFTCDSSLGGVAARIESARPLEEKNDKPDYVAPRRVAFTFNGAYAKRHEGSFFTPEIQVSRLDDFAKIHAIEPRYVEQLERQVRQLRSILSRRPKAIKKEIPYLPYVEGGQILLAHVKYITFKNGKGISFITQYAFEPTLISNQALTYMFEGITDDGKYYVTATFPISSSILPAEFSREAAAAEGLDFNSGMFTPAFQKKHERYLVKIGRKLETLPRDEFQPTLKLFDGLVSSLSIDGDLLNSSLNK